MMLGKIMVLPKFNAEYAYAEGLDLDKTSIAFGEALAHLYVVSRGIRDFASINNINVPNPTGLVDRLERHIKYNPILYRNHVNIKYVPRHMEGASKPITDIFIYRPEAEWKIEAAHKILSLNHTDKIPFEGYHKMLGTLFCYSEQAIEEFIESFNK